MKLKLNNLKFSVTAIFMFAMNITMSAQCPSGAVSYWKLDEADEAVTSYLDTISSHNATVSVAPVKVAGVIGNARSFDGTTQRISVASHNDYNFSNSTSFSLELWTKYTDVAFGTTSKILICRGTSTTVGGKWWLYADRSTGEIIFSATDNNALNVSLASAPLNDGKWHHIVAVRDAINDNLKLYVDGSLVNMVAANYTGNFSSTEAITIGHMMKSGTPDNYFKGSLDEILIYNRVVYPEEVLDHYNKALEKINYCQGTSASITSIPSLVSSVGQLYTYNVDATGTQPIIYKLVTKPTGMTIDSITGIISWVPSSTSDNGSVKIIALNPLFAPADTQEFKINIAQEVACPENLIGLWRLDEKTGKIYSDVYGNHASAIVAPSPTTGIVSGAQRFDSTTFVNIPDNDMFEWKKDTAFSIEAWVNFSYNSSTNRVIVGRKDPNGKACWWLGVSNLEKPSFVIMDTSGVDTILISPTTISDKKWHQVVGVWDGSKDKISLYVDGVLKREGTKIFNYDFTRKSDPASANIGWFNAGSGYHFVGDIDEVAIFNYALPADSVLKFFNDTVPEGHCRPKNFAPAFTSTPITTAMDSVEYKYELTATDLNNDELTFAMPIGPDWLSVKKEGGKTYLMGTPDTSAVENVTITVTDSIAPAVPQTFQITVVPFNATPKITNQDSLSTEMNTTLKISLANFTFVDPDSDSANIKLIILNGANYTATDTSITPATDFTGYLNVGVQVTDGITNSEIYNAKVKVYENFAPVFTSEPDTIAMDSVEYKYVITATDQNGDELSFTKTVGPTWLSIIERNDSTILIGTPDTSDIYDITITVTDGKNPVTQSFKLNVKPYSKAPIISGQSAISTSKNTPVTLTLANFNIIDPDTEISDMTLTVMGGTNYTVSGTTVTPATDFTGDLTVAVQVSDGANNSNIFNATVNVTDISGLDNSLVQQTLRIYPNPANDHIVVSLNKMTDVTIIQIYSTSGKLMMQQLVHSNNERVDMNGLSEGTYIYRLLSGNNTFTGSLVIK